MGPDMARKAPRLLYALVSRDRTVLAEYTDQAGNFPTVTRVLLGKIDASVDTRMSYVYDNFRWEHCDAQGLAFPLPPQRVAKHLPTALPSVAMSSFPCGRRRS